MPLHALEHYDISAKRGFLCRYDPSSIVLEGDWAHAAKIAMSLPDLIPSGRVRHLLETRLPDGLGNEHVAGLSDHQARMAMVHYSFLVQSYVWGEAEAPKILPRTLAKPISALADRLGQQPLLPYSGYVLDNWSLLDPAGDVSMDNIYMIQNFLAGQDEAWFVLIHVAIEAAMGPALGVMPDIIQGVKTGDLDGVQSKLENMANVWETIKHIFYRMPERCDPYIYFERVRPYIHGWKDNPALPEGLIYEGVEKYEGRPQAFRGQTGSQSSIVPAMDALLGIGHAADPLKTFLDQLHIYRPTGHRQFIDDLRATSGLREFARTSGHKGLITAYNANVQAVSDFRTRHLEYAASYIHKQGKTAQGNDNEVGTGGTPFMKYLKKHRDETQANLLVA